MSLLASNLAFAKEKAKEFAGKKSTFLAVRNLYERDGMDPAVRALREMASQPDGHFTLHPELDSFAYRLMLAGKLDDAQKMMEALAEIFPDKDNAFDSLGELFLRRNDKDRAAQCFQKALELNPNNRNAEAQLKTTWIAILPPSLSRGASGMSWRRKRAKS